mmetsp:Transcript_107650/g.332526  ORF Transcript_107650/g.332526 Transcript_107650/m.332526 type:complete len:782 (-) Transcript_107650:19-2364(-)
MPKQNSIQAALFGKKAPVAAETPLSKPSPQADATPDVPLKKRRLGEGTDSASTKPCASGAAAPAPALAEASPVPATARAPAVPLTADTAAATAAPSLDAGPLSVWGARPGPASAELISPSFDPPMRAADAPTGKPVPFSLLSEALVTIEGLKGSGKGSRKTMTIVLSNVFRFLIFYRPADLVPTIYILSNKVAPDYEGVELGVGDGLIVKTISEVFGRSDSHIKSALASGDARDLGEVALQSRVSQKVLMMPPKLSIERVFSEMKAVAKASGKDSQRAKKDRIEKLLAASRGEEAKYIVRMLQAKLRVGIQTPTVLQALADAFSLTSPALPGGRPAAADVRRAAQPPAAAALEARMGALEAAVRQAFSEMPNFERLVGALLEGREGAALAEACHISLGVPVKPMLAKPSKGIAEVAERLSGKRFTGEWKYDGERAQVHVVAPGDIQVYSRNSENMTEKYPDVVRVVQETLCDGVQSCIIDSELVAYDQVNGKILPFQVLTTRGRKNISIESIKVNVCLFAFDCMLCNGEPMVTETLETRRKKLWTILRETEGKVKFATYRNFEELKEEEVQAFLDESVAGSCEGLMLKTLSENATYEPSKRSLNWLKLKKDYLEGMSDSIDVVPIGAFYGKGKRTGAYGAFLLAIYDPEAEEFQTVCKAGTGFSDEDLVTHYNFFKGHTLPRADSNYNVTDKVAPDVWLEACQVWEIKAADLSISPVHTSAMGIKADGKGIGLRFPRFLRVREDKSPEESTGPDQIVEMFEAQASVSKDGRGGGGGDDFDF